MKILRDEKENASVLRCEGRLDAATVPQLEKTMNDLMAENHNRILLDLNQVDYLSSAGIRLLLSMTKKLKGAGGLLALFNLHEDVLEIITMAGFEQLLNIYHSEREAFEKL